MGAGGKAGDGEVVFGDLEQEGVVSPGRLDVDVLDGDPRAAERVGDVAGVVLPKRQSV